MSHNQVNITNTFYRKRCYSGINFPILEFPDKSKHGRHMIYNEHYDNKVYIFNDTSFVDPNSKSITTLLK